MLINLVIFVCTAISFMWCFRNDGRWDVKKGLISLRFFTILSNLLCALSALLIVFSLAAGGVPRWIWVMKYICTAAVTVTFLTVMVFLGPTAGYKAMLSSWNLYLHLVGPLLAIFSFCFTERFYPLPLPLSLCGVLPVIAYGAVYLYKVVLCPEGGRWDDFYGFNKSGKWPVSFAAMVVGGVLICLVLRMLYSI